MEKDTKSTETTHAQSVEDSSYDERRNMSASEIQAAIRSGSIPKMSKSEAMHIAHVGGWEADAVIEQLEKELVARGDKKGIFDIEFQNPKHFTWLLVAFASMGGLLSGLDQSLISGANLFLPIESVHIIFEL